MSLDKFQLNFKVKMGVGITFLLLIGVLSFYSIILNWDIHCQDPDLLITIPKGSSAQSVAGLLKEESCFESEAIFKIERGKIELNLKIFQYYSCRRGEDLKW